jgi:tripartite-type tricarboxylate transporter receptor subunit TctC
MSLRTLGGVVAVLTAMVACAGALAEEYPGTAVRMIVPFPPGGGTDLMARITATKLGQIFGQQFVVDNTSPKRSLAMPDLPMVAESGVPGFDVRVWFAVFMPAGVPRHRQRRERAHPQDARTAGASPAPDRPGRGLGEQHARRAWRAVKVDLARWTKVVKATGVAAADRPAP